MTQKIDIKIVPPSKINKNRGLQDRSKAAYALYVGGSDLIPGNAWSPQHLQEQHLNTELWTLPGTAKYCQVLPYC